nr:cytochrome B6-f complex subunit [Timspurckia oligopyrenoides]UNJ17509.1 cytochrome B6-f complex subunit [Timspurckia oligopyrenoides]
MAEIVNAALVIFSMTIIGLGLGFVLLRVQGE